MNKKELRKELELTLVKAIEEVLNKKNSEATKKIRKTTYDASKSVAKKFYKSLKEKPKAKAKPKSKPATKAKAKTSTPAPKASTSKKKTKSKK